MHFKSWSYPVESYAQALEAAGLLIEALREPQVPAEAVAADPAEERRQRLPAFLFIRAVSHGRGMDLVTQGHASGDAA